MNREILYLTGGFVVGFLAGLAVSVVVLKEKYEQQAQEEIDDVKSHYRLIRKEGMDTPKEAVEKVSNYHEQLKDLRYFQESENEDERREFEESVQEELPGFELPPPGVPIHERQPNEVELQEQVILDKRDTSGPYILIHDEFMYEREEYDKETLTYYEYDDILADLTEQPIEDVEGTVGDEALSKFGMASKDDNVVFVRNERLGTDFEIIRRPDSYQEVVLGIKEPKRAPKFREDD